MKLIFVKLRIPISLIMVLLWVGLIFYFGSAPGWESWQTSSRALEAARLTGVLVESEELVRKMAHVFLYAVLGGLSLNLFHQLGIIKKRWAKWVSAHKFKLAPVISLVVAVADEINQHFTPERSGIWQDVVLDVLAAVVAAGVMYGIYKIRNKRQKRSINSQNSGVGLCDSNGSR